MCSFHTRRPAVSTKLYVGNLPETVRKADLQQAFEKYGKVLECDIVMNYAFVVSAHLAFIEEKNTRRCTKAKEEHFQMSCYESLITS